MKVREYLQALQSLVDTNPEVLDMDVIASSDDEGNDVGKVSYSASLQKWVPAERCFDEDEGVWALCVN